MKTLLKLLVVNLLLVVLMPNSKLSAQVSTWDGTWEPWTNGTGTEEDPFLIENAQQLAYLAFRVNNGLDAGGGHVTNHELHYKLMVDIDLNGSDDFQWEPIGYWMSETDYQCFGGCFDGNGHIISKLYINSDAYQVGLFGYVDSAVIENINITQSTVVTTNYAAGGIVGSAQGTTSIINCNNLYVNISSEDSSGGILGSVIDNAVVIVSDCCNYGEIWSHKQSGGIVGCLYECSTDVIKCYNKGGVFVSEDIDYQHAGGIVGLSYYSTVNITNCYNTGSASVVSDGYSHFAGGIIGLSSHYNANLANCYNVGTVSITSYGNAGGIGNIDYGGVIYDINCCYLNTCGGNDIYCGTPRTEVFMKSQDFVDLLNSGNETDVWAMDTENTNDGYPIIGGTYWGVSENFFTNTDLVIVYPNPATDYINIVGDVASYEIYDVVGKCVRRDALPYVSTDDLQSGVYIMKFVMLNGSVVTKRIVKK